MAIICPSCRWAKFPNFLHSASVVLIVSRGMSAYSPAFACLPMAKLLLCSVLKNCQIIENCNYSFKKAAWYVEHHP